MRYFIDMRFFMVSLCAGFTVLYIIFYMKNSVYLHMYELLIPMVYSNSALGVNYLGVAFGADIDPSAPWWRHCMETLSALLVLCEGNHGSPMESPHRGQVIRNLDVFFVVSFNKLLNKWSSWDTMTPMWRHCHAFWIWSYNPLFERDNRVPDHHADLDFHLFNDCRNFFLQGTHKRYSTSRRWGRSTAYPVWVHGVHSPIPHFLEIHNIVF